MSKKSSLPTELIAALSSETIESLSDIAQLYVSKYSSDASTMIQNGCVLLAISRVDNDESGDGFRFLIGLPNGTEVSPYLRNYFQR
jgi:hypothetical protein